ncbi:MAG: helix-turn-helix domain-containing protein [Clostridia bacterium]|nr:helix-turn-helix domain-containing protein [Clostridia bacterium]
MNIYENHRMDDPRLPFILHSTRRAPRRPAGSGNWHENIEILWFTEGEGVVTVDAERFSVTAGDIVILGANALHTIASISQIHYYCLIVDRSFSLENHFDTSTMRYTPVVRDPEAEEGMRTVVAAFAEPSETPFRVQRIRASVLSFLVLLCSRYGAAEGTPSPDSRLLLAIKEALGYIHAHFESDLSLDDMAARVGFSKYYFAREFRRITGHTFVSYLCLLRCEKAKQLLQKGGMRIGEVAAQCGFENHSYFTKTFRKYVGVLPGAYRASAMRIEDTKFVENLQSF